MSVTKYIELNSMYRDRNLWPFAAEFEIPISQTGKKNMYDAIDPVSLATPVFSWTGNNLDLNNSYILGTFPVGPGSTSTLTVSNIDSLKYTSDNITFIIESHNQPMQELKNYYNRLIVANFTSVNSVPPTPISYRRIVAYNYLGSESDGLGGFYYRAQVTVYNSFRDGIFTYGDLLYIADHSDFSDLSVPLLFIPNGAIQENAYATYIVYNETINEYRPISRYDNITNIIYLDTTGTSGPISNSWSTTDNFSLRIIQPFIPTLGTILYPLSILTSSYSEITVNDPSGILSSINNYYKNEFLRILPYNGVGNYNYNYSSTPSNNEARRIISYTYKSNVATFKVYPNYTSIPVINSPIEILPFSYDNFTPFIYTGTLVSQSNMVCYEIQLISLTLPNAVLNAGEGGRIAFYPFIYVQLSNISSATSGLKNISYSNDPNSVNALFKIPIFDVSNPLNTPFIRLSGSGMTQTIKFKPNSNLYMKISLPSGDIFKTILPEYYSPAVPNLLAQITAIFSIRRSD